MTSKDGRSRTTLILLVASVMLFLAAFAVRTCFLSNVMPIASAEETQSVWALEAAFLLRSVENVAAFAAVLVLIAWMGRKLARLRSPR